MNTKLNRAAAAIGGVAIAAAVAVGCAETKEAAKDVASGAASVGSSAASVAGSAASVAGSAASSGASVAGSMASSGASAASSVASSGASVAGSAASSGASVAGSAASSGASVAGSAVSSGASAASSVVSSVLNGAPEAVKEAPGKAITETTEKTGFKWWWIPIGIAIAGALAALLRSLTRRKPEPVKVAVQRAPDVKTTRVVTDPKQTTRRPLDDDRDRRND